MTHEKKLGGWFFILIPDGAIGVGLLTGIYKLFRLELFLVFLKFLVSQIRKALHKIKYRLLA